MITINCDSCGASMSQVTKYAKPRKLIIDYTSEKRAYDLCPDCWAKLHETMGFTPPEKYVSKPYFKRKQAGAVGTTSAAAGANAPVKPVESGTDVEP